MLCDHFGAREGCRGQQDALPVQCYPSWRAYLTVQQERESCARAVFLWISVYGNMIISRMFGFSFSKSKLFKIQYNVEQTAKPGEEC